MISAEEVQRATKAGETFTPALRDARYHRDADRVEIVTPWCTIFVNRDRIDELRDVSAADLETISVSAVGLHVDSADIDINAAGLLADLGRQLESYAAQSY
jgi:hypothetical protein